MMPQSPSKPPKGYAEVPAPPDVSGPPPGYIAVSPPEMTMGEPPQPPGFFTRLGQSLGIPTSMSELQAIQPSTTEKLIGPAATAAKMVYGYGKNIVSAAKAGGREMAEAAANIAQGQPVLPNLGKAAFASTKADSEGPLSIVGGAGLQQAGEDIGTGNLPGAAGGIVGSVINGMLLRSMTRTPKPNANIEKLTFATTGGSKLDYPRLISKVTPDVEKAMANAGVDINSAKVGDFVQGVSDANRMLEAEYTKALIPLAKSQVVPQAEIANVIRGEADKMVTKIPVERQLQAYLRKQAVVYEQPFTLEELDRARRNANARLTSYENATAPNKAAVMRKNADVMLDKAVADGARDIIYGQMEKFYGKPDYFRDLKLRQTAMMQLAPEMENHLKDLANATARQKGAPLLSGENVSLYGHPEQGRLGMSIHTLQKMLPGDRFTPMGAANTAMKGALSQPSLVTRNLIMAQPLRFLLNPPGQPPAPPQ